MTSLHGEGLRRRHGHRDHTREEEEKSDFPLTFPMDEATNLFSGLEGNDKAKSEADDVGEYDGYPQRLDNDTILGKSESSARLAGGSSE